MSSETQFITKARTIYMALLTTHIIPKPMVKKFTLRLAVVAGLFLAPINVCAAEKFTSEIERILELKEEQIDTGRAALTFAKEIYPSIDVDRYSREIDSIATGAKSLIDRYGKYDPDSVIRAMNTYYYREWGVKYDKTAGGRSNVGNYFINYIIENKIGQCTTIPMLYMAVAQRLGYPVYAVVAPEHNFLRFVDPNLKEQNIELSGSAGYSSDADYARRLNISRLGTESGAYLRTLSKREYLGVLLQQNAIVFMGRQDLSKALLYFQEAYRIDDRNVYASKNLSVIYRMLAAKSDGSLRAHFSARADHFSSMADNLGWTVDPDVNNR